MKVACLQVQGDEALKKANYQKAVHKYTQGLMLHPKNYELLACRAVAFIQMEKYEDARLDGEILIQVQPEILQDHTEYNKKTLFLGTSKTLIRIIRNHYLQCLAHGCLGNLQITLWSILCCLDHDPMHQNELAKKTLQDHCQTM
ncbi:uncharacterized protein [Narcine bancroftii]|uniref:uncharacterized protein n=1 Tax=Narcine bancroftii TaxID=1343680 RepID=UPI003831E85C